MLVNFLKINIKDKTINLKKVYIYNVFHSINYFLFIILLISKAINRVLEAKSSATYNKKFFFK